MADEKSKKNTEVRLVKVNSKEKTAKRYDAYGYEIPEEKPAAPERTYAAEEPVRTGSGISSPGHRYDADIRAAIESGAHRRTGQNAVKSEPHTEPSTKTNTDDSTGPVRDGADNTVRNRRSHVSNRNEYDREIRKERESKTVPDASRTRRNSGKKKDTAQRSHRQALKEQKAEQKAEQEARQKAEQEAKRKAEESRPLTAHEKRQKIAKARRRRTAANIFKVIAVVLVVALIIVLITVNSKKGSGINTQYLSAGYVEDAALGELSFLRAEKPVYSSFSGVFVPCVNEGDRVGNNAVIGHVIKAEYSDALAELKDVESRIAAAMKAAAYVEGGKSGEMLALENAIDNGIGSMSKLAMSGELSGYHYIFGELSDMFARKNEIEMSADNADTYISNLQKERNSILNRISSSMHEVHASASGVVSFRCDGNESIVSDAMLSLENRIAETNFASLQSSTLTPAELQSISLPGGQLTVSSGQSVGSGTVVARIATGNSYYVTIPVDDASSHHISNGETALVYVPEDNLYFDAQIVGLYYCGSRTLAVLKAARALDGTVSLRAKEGRVVFSHVEGLKVPLRVLSDWDSAGVTARLTILRSGYVRFAYVNVLGRDNDYAIINSRSTLDDGSGVSVRENDEYIVNYDKVYEGQAI